MRPFPLVSLLALASSVFAQQPDASAIPACALTCATSAASSTGCNDITNTQCVCTSTFLGAVQPCVTSSCQGRDLAAALSSFNALCPGLAPGGGGGATGTPTSAAASSIPAPTASPTVAPGTPPSTPLPSVGPVPQCAATCSAQNGCSNPADPNCVCKDDFKNNVAQCLLKNCTTDEIITVKGLSKSLCSGSIPGIPVAGPGGTSTYYPLGSTPIAIPGSPAVVVPPMGAPGGMYPPIIIITLPPAAPTSTANNSTSTNAAYSAMPLNGQGVATGFVVAVIGMMFAPFLL
ncbi:hypothetical protein BOTBODRAFT_51560 [Botryobasidium botryosum FD-172 SS1]|uniref:CFEM domain-containing protein n=1 Tax=Botryobasidium botryosum (strain FD-172 SS1) TaxID=930990 RepID=A0A067N8Y5_BOTB1|nr:hypothetical protein BOTBODRAFT_51560 [Botryobasidium botryosum FD-172 SS1]